MTPTEIKAAALVLNAASEFWSYVTSKEPSLATKLGYARAEGALTTLCEVYGARVVRDMLVARDLHVPACVATAATAAGQYRALCTGHRFHVFGTRANGSLDTHREVGKGFPVSPAGIARALRKATEADVEITNIRDGKLML